MRVVCEWYAGGMRVVCGWYVAAMLVVCGCYAGGMRLLCGDLRRPSPGVVNSGRRAAMLVVCACYAGLMRLLCWSYDSTIEWSAGTLSARKRTALPARARRSLGKHPGS